jgi:hypothetical protein
VNVKSNGTITSPRFPKDYGTDQRCVWILSAKPSSKIAIHFKEFKIQNATNGSSCLDYVEIKDGQLGRRINQGYDLIFNQPFFIYML